MKAVLYNYPVELECGDQVYVVVTDEEPYRPATRYAPAEGGWYDWHLSFTPFGDPDEDLFQVPQSELDRIERNMEESLNYWYGE